MPCERDAAAPVKRLVRRCSSGGFNAVESGPPACVADRDNGRKGCWSRARVAPARLQQIAKAETGNEPSIRKVTRACYEVDRGLRTIARDAAAPARQRKRRGSIMGAELREPLMSIRPSKTLKPSFSADDRANKQSSECLRLEQRQRNEGGCSPPAMALMVPQRAWKK